MPTFHESKPWTHLWGSSLAPEVSMSDTIPTIFAEHVRENADRALLTYFDRTLSVGEVDAEATAFAAALRDGGIGVGDRVAIYLQNQPEFVIATLAAWKLGAIVVPINPMYRERELLNVLTDSGATALVVLDTLWHDVAQNVLPDTHVALTVATSGLTYLGDGARPDVLAQCVEQQTAGLVRFGELVAAHRESVVDRVTVVGDDTAFLAYTSGTTGPPKGAMIKHSGLVFASRSVESMRGLDGRDVIFAVAPLFHITGLVMALAIGLLLPARLVLAYRFDAPTALALIDRHRVSFTVGSITVFIALMEHPDFSRHDMSSLQKIISGGAPVPPAVAARYEAATGAYLYNGYGLTEATSPAFGTPTGARGPVDPTSGSLALGIPLPGTDCRLVDDNGADVPLGAPGEIVIRGPQVIDGYWHRPEETALAIRDGWLYTGDVAVMDTQGWFYLVDRKKDQINVSGFKVWPREVEDVLYEHPCVSEVAVVGLQDCYRGETVKAFVSLRAGAQATPEELIQFSKERLAAYKYPRAVEILDTLPKTASGKILRRELRETSSGSVAPANGVA